MATFANVKPLPITNGVVYASDVPLTSTEADLGTATQNVIPIPIEAGQGIQAVVQLAVSGNPAGNSTYIVMQTDMGGGVWIDVAWCMYTNTQAPNVFVLSAGTPTNNAFQQVRQAGATPNPQANGSNAMVLGNRIRFVGKSILSGGSSYAPGQFVGVRATITYKVLNLR